MALASRLEAAVQESGLEAGLGARGVPLSIPCKVASVVWEDAQGRFRRYSTLVYVLALIALAAIIAAIAFFFVVDDTASAGIVSLVSGLVTGTLARFIQGERDTAREDRDKAGEIVGDKCEGQTAEEVIRSLGG